MDKLIMALGPVFAAGMGIQQLGEILDPVLEKISPDNKRVVIGTLSLIIGLAVAFGANLHVLYLLGAPDDRIVNPLVTGFLISGGTEGINSILKFLKYTKEDKKNEAAAKAPAGPGAAAPTANPVAQPSTAALQDLNKK
jgi:hypothetical protein